VPVERIDYQAGGVKAKGRAGLQRQIKGPRPLLLVAPNWLGVTNRIKARQMAATNTVGLCRLHYGEGKLRRSAHLAKNG